MRSKRLPQYNENPCYGDYTRVHFVRYVGQGCGGSGEGDAFNFGDDELQNGVERPHPTYVGRNKHLFLLLYGL